MTHSFPTLRFSGLIVDACAPSSAARAPRIADFNAKPWNSGTLKVAPTLNGSPVPRSTIRVRPALALTLRLGRALPRAARTAPAAACSPARSEEHTSELQSLMRISYAVFCLKKTQKKTQSQIH